jgi:hypothetical protein
VNHGLVGAGLGHESISRSESLRPTYIPRKGKTVMRLLFIPVALALGAAAHAQDYSSSEYCDPWCSHSAGRDCSYHTFQQCLAETSGKRSCYSNPFLYQCSRPGPDDGIGQSAARGRGWSAFGRASQDLFRRAHRPMSHKPAH